MKNIIILFLFVCLNARAYEPRAKIECKKRLSNELFVYFEILPLSFNGHYGSIFLYKKNELVFEKSEYFFLNPSKPELSFQSSFASLVFEKRQEEAQDGDRFKGLYIPLTINDPISETKLDCDYFIEVDPE
jgi:hypothetical protein